MVNVAKHALSSKVFSPRSLKHENYCPDTFYYYWVYVTGSGILSLVEVHCWRHKTCAESDVIKFARNVNWISAHWLKSFKASPQEYDAAFSMVTFTFFICTPHVRSTKRDAMNQSNDSLSNLYMLFISINGNEDGKSCWYGTPEGTFSSLFLSCAHRLLTRFNNIITRLNYLLCRTHKLIILF